MLNKYNSKTAYTLAEVLITLMVIGVIAALTIPGLKRYAGMEENVSLTKKAYSTISNATRLSEVKHGEMKRWGSFSQAEDAEGDEAPAGLSRAFEYYKEQMNISRDCSAGGGAENDGESCWTQTKNLSGENYGGASNIVENSMTFTSVDGMNWSISAINDAATYGVNAGGEDCLLAWVDINAAKKPNMLGYDVFAFIIHPDRGVLPAGTDNDSANCDDARTGIDCSARVISESKISY